MSQEQQKAETEFWQTNEKYASHFAELKSTRSTASSRFRTTSIASNFVQELQTRQEQVISDSNNKQVSNGDSAPTWNRLALTDAEFRLKFLVDHTNAVPRVADNNIHLNENSPYQEAGQEAPAVSDT